MEDIENGGMDHYETEDRREYGDRPKKTEGSDKYADSTRGPRKSYSNQNDYRSRGNYSQSRNYQRKPYQGDEEGGYNRSGEGGYNRPRGNFGGGQHRQYNSENGEGYQRKPYRSGEGNGYNRSGNGAENGYNRPRSNDGNGYSRSGEGGYNRPRGNFGGGQRRQYNSGNGEDYQRKPYQNGEEHQRKPYHSGEEYQRKPYRSGEGNGYNRSENGYNRSRSNEGNGYSRSGEGNGYNRTRNGEGYDKPRRKYSDEGGYGKDYKQGKGYGARGKNGAGLRPRKPKAPVPESGIDRMIRRKQSENAYSDNDMVKAPIKDVVRLNKFISDSGICSRREADTFISAGVVTVNGEVVTQLGTKINIFNDDVRFNGERLKGEPKVYIVMNKPKGFVTTVNDPHADKTVMDLIKSCAARVFPVGRLDKNTTGVLMFTNDGDISEKLTHPAYDKKKIYQVTLDSELSQEDYDKIVAGIPLSDGVIAADALEYIDENDHSKLGIEIHSGKNRIVRRIFESLGYSVKGLDRVYFAGLTKKGIKRGGWRYLTDSEINILRMGAYN